MGGGGRALESYKKCETKVTVKLYLTKIFNSRSEPFFFITVIVQHFQQYCFRSTCVKASLILYSVFI